MKTNYRIVLIMLVTGLFGINYALGAEPTFEQTQLIKKGEYLAIVADCAACHRPIEETGKPFSGGYTIDSPMGKIIASNITPSDSYGIGKWTEQQFADALRKGINAKGDHLYPAMPYTSYQQITDEDIHALYTYFMQGIAPVDKAPNQQTSLSCPFNIRQLMWGWNLLFTHEKPFTPSATSSAQPNRGHYLVDALAHCSTCHTPRNALMAETSSQYLAGAALGGWYAPNITSDKESGIGTWSTDDIVTYLKTGHVNDKAQAAGPMAEAVEHSFRKMSDDDLHAMALWIQQVPAITTPTANRSQSQAQPDINAVITGQGNQASLANSSTTDGAVLYESACASCHGRQGEGTSDHFYPPLTHNTAVSSITPNNLIMTISEGLVRQGQDTTVSMPAFNQQLSPAQIASVTQYVRQHFAGIDSPVSAEQVKQLQEGGEAPFIVKYTWPMLIGGLILLALLILIVMRRKR